jgi:hypothetical protein
MVASPPESNSTESFPLSIDDQFGAAQSNSPPTRQGKRKQEGSLEHQARRQAGLRCDHRQAEGLIAAGDGVVPPGDAQRTLFTSTWRVFGGQMAPREGAEMLARYTNRVNAGFLQGNLRTTHSVN